MQLADGKATKHAQRLQELEPNLQHDENPKVHCGKFRRKLQQFKEFIKQSATPPRSYSSSELAQPE